VRYYNRRRQEETLNHPSFKLTQDDWIEVFCTCTGNWPHYDYENKTEKHQKQCPLSNKEHIEKVVASFKGLLDKSIEHSRKLEEELAWRNKDQEPVVVLVKPYDAFKHNTGHTTLADDYMKVLISICSLMGCKYVVGKGTWNNPVEEALLDAKPLQDGEGLEDWVRPNYNRLYQRFSHNDNPDRFIFSKIEDAKEFYKMACLLADMMMEEYQRGKKEGSSILMKLSKGEITMEEMNRVITDPKR